VSGHSGRCFRATRRTKRRKELQGKRWDYPVRWKAPLALRPFLNAEHSNTRTVQHAAFAHAVAKYAQHQRMTGGKDIIRGAARGR